MKAQYKSLDLNLRINNPVLRKLYRILTHKESIALSNTHVIVLREGVETFRAKLNH